MNKDTYEPVTISGLLAGFVAKEQVRGKTLATWKCWSGSKPCDSQREHFCILFQGVRKSYAHGQIELSMISPNMANRVAHVALRICLVLP